MPKTTRVEIPDGPGRTLTFEHRQGAVVASISTTRGRVVHLASDELLELGEAIDSARYAIADEYERRQLPAGAERIVGTDHLADREVEHIVRDGRLIVRDRLADGTVTETDEGPADEKPSGDVPPGVKFDATEDPAMGGLRRAANRARAAVAEGPAGS